MLVYTFKDEICIAKKNVCYGNINFTKRYIKVNFKPRPTGVNFTSIHLTEDYRKSYLKKLNMVLKKLYRNNLN